MTFYGSVPVVVINNAPLSTGAIVGIVVVIIIFKIILITAIVIRCRRRHIERIRKREMTEQQEEPLVYNTHPAPLSQVYPAPVNPAPVNPEPYGYYDPQAVARKPVPLQTSAAPVYA